MDSGMNREIRALTGDEIDGIAGGADEQQPWRVVRSMWGTYAAVMDIIDAAKAKPAAPCK